MESDLLKGNVNIKRSRISPFWRQLALVIGTSLNVAGECTAVGFTAIFFPQIDKNPEGFQNDDASKALIGSAINMGVLFGVWLVYLLLDRAGRKICHLLTILPTIFGWTMITFATNNTVIIIARFIQGIATGIRIPVCSIIIGECTSPKNRGAFLATVNLSVAIGIFYVRAIGTFFGWKIASIASNLLSVMSFFVIVSLPDSPVGLAKAGKSDLALKSFKWYRGAGFKAEEEFKEIENNIIKNKDDNVAPLQILTTPEFYKPFFIVALLGMAYHFSGFFSIGQFAIEILNDILKSDTSSYYILLAIDLFKICISLCACSLIKRFKRKTVYNISAFITVVSLLVLSLNTYLDKKIDYNLKFISVAALFVYNIAVGAGVQNMFYITVGEIFPAKIKHFASTISVFFVTFPANIVLLSAPFSISYIGKSGTFLSYAVVVLSCWLLLIFKMPEAQNRTLVAIEMELKQNNQELKV